MLARYFKSRTRSTVRAAKLRTFAINRIALKRVLDLGRLNKHEEQNLSLIVYSFWKILEYYPDFMRVFFVISANNSVPEAA